MVHTDFAPAILDVTRGRRSQIKMSKKQRQTRVSQGKVPARYWGNTADYCDMLQTLRDADAVREGSTFMLDLSLKTCLVNFDFFLIQVLEIMG